MEGFALNPASLPSIPERKGTLYLRSDHMKYGRATLNSNWHEDREAEPKDYNVCGQPTETRDLLKATYTRIGNISGPPPETTTQEAMNEAHKLKKSFETQDTHKPMVIYSNFNQATSPRLSQSADRGGGGGGYHSVLPRHKVQQGTRYLDTTHKADYQYPLGWTPSPEKTESASDRVEFRHQRSEFTDTANHTRPGLNTWQDCSGAIRCYDNTTDTH